MSQPDPDARPAAWMISGAFLFATMGALAHGLGRRCDWMTIALVRAGFMFLSALVIARTSGVQLVVWRPRTLWMRSFAGSLSLVCSFYALPRLPVGDVLTLTNTYPLWIVVLTWLGARRIPRGGDVVRVGCGLAGVALIEQPHFDGDRFAVGVALLSSLAAAVAMINLHKLRHVDARAVVAHFAGVATCTVGLWYILRGPASGTLVDGSPAGHPLEIDGRSWLMLAGVGLTGTIGQIFLTRAYAAGAPARVAVLGLTQVVFGLALDVVIWQRPLSAQSLMGTALVLAPTAWLVLNAGGAAPARAAEPEAQPTPAREAA